MLGGAVAIGIDVGSQHLVASEPQCAHDNNLALKEGDTHLGQPGLKLLSLLNHLPNHVYVAVNPLTLVLALAQAAVVGLEHVQVLGRKQREVSLGHTACQLGVSPSQIGGNLSFKLLQHGQVLGMHAVGSHKCYVAWLVGVLGVIWCIEGFLAPLQYGFKVFYTAGARLYLIVGLAIVAHARCGVRMFGVPHQIWHNALEDATRHKGVATNLGVLLDDKHGVALLCGLGSCCHAGTATTDNNNIPRAFDRFLLLYGQTGTLELSRI